MPAVQQFKAEEGRKLADRLAMFDSPADAEAAAWFCKTRMLLSKLGVKFYAVVETDEYKTAMWGKLGGCAAPCETGGKCSHAPEALRPWFERKHGGNGGAAELAEAREKAAGYCRELKEAMAKVTHYASLAQTQEQTIKELRRKLAARPGASSGARLVSGGLVAFVVLIALALMIAGGLALGQ